MRNEFVGWLLKELDSRGWSQSELARRSGVSATAINKVINGERFAGVDICRGIARAFGMRDVEVLQMAGLADPEPPSDTPSVREMISKFTRLSDEDQAYMLKIVTALDETEQAQKRRVKKPAFKPAKP